MKRNLLTVFLSACIVSLCCTTIQAQKSNCDVPDVGILEPGEFKTKASILHIWQGAVGGVNTKNADRITGLYDFDLYYLLAAKVDENKLGDYLLICSSFQASFGNGITGSKVGGPFELNENAKGDLSGIVDKLYVEFTMADRKFTFDVGKIDLEDFFDLSAVAGCEKSQFIARPLFKNEAIPFPSKGLGARIIWQPNGFLYAQAAVADAQADKRETGFRTTFHDEDYLVSMAEIGIKPKLFGRDGTYRFILWYDPQDKGHLDGSTTKRDDIGFAVSFDQKITEKLTGFFRYGWANDKYNNTEDFVSFGGQIEGLIKGRDEDVFAIGYARSVLSPDGLSAGSEREIDLIETYYKIVINEHIQVSPNIQFVMDPGGVTSESPATVFGVRCRIKL